MKSRLLKMLEPFCIVFMAFSIITFAVATGMILVKLLIIFNGYLKLGV